MHGLGLRARRARAFLDGDAGARPRGRGAARGRPRGASARTARWCPGSAAGCSFRFTISAGASSGSAAGSSGRASRSISTLPRSPIFHKGTQLYNLHQAKGAIRKEESVIVVEGYFDVLRLVLAGIEHVVAPLGTALTAGPGGAAPAVRAAGHPALRQRPGRAPRHLPGRRRAAAPRRAGARRHAARRARIPTPWCEGRRGGARADPARRDRRAGAEDPAAGAEGLVRGRGASARGARSAAADHPGGGGSDHPRSLPQDGLRSGRA